jgi:hypothetical protein
VYFYGRPRLNVLGRHRRLHALVIRRLFANANMMPIVCLIADERYRATGYGIINFCSCFIGGITIYLGGALRDAPYLSFGGLQRLSASWEA